MATAGSVLKALNEDCTRYVQEWTLGCELVYSDGVREKVPQNVWQTLKREGYLDRVSLSRYMLSSCGKREARKYGASVR